MSLPRRINASLLVSTYQAGKLVVVSPGDGDGAALFLLNSGHGTLIAVDLARGTHETVASLRGYTRGLAIHAG